MTFLKDKFFVLCVLEVFTCLTDFFILLLNLVFSNRERDSKTGCVRFLHQNAGFDDLPLLWCSNIANFLANSLICEFINKELLV